MDTKELTLQSIPIRYITKVGAEKAYVQAKLCHLQLQATTVIGGKRWFNCPVGRRSKGKEDKSWYRPLEDLFPWRTSQQIHKMIVSPATTKSTTHKRSTRRDTSLEKAGYIEVFRGLNTDNWNKTLRYSVPDKVILQGFMIVTDDNGKRKLKAKKDSVWCFNEDVERLGSVSRAIVHNIVEREFHLLGRNREDTIYLQFNRNAIARETGLPLSTVSDIFKEFEQDKILSTYDNGKTHLLLVKNRITDDLLKGRGEGRKKVATVAAIVGTSARNPCPMFIPKFPDNGLRAMVAAVEKQMQERLQPKPKKVRTRRRGKKVVPFKNPDDVLARPYTKENIAYWKEFADEYHDYKMRPRPKLEKAALSS